MLVQAVKKMFRRRYGDALQIRTEQNKKKVKIKQGNCNLSIFLRVTFVFSIQKRVASSVSQRKTIIFVLGYSSARVTEVKSESRSPRDCFTPKKVLNFNLQLVK